jgi:hypothetical protein
VTVPPTIPEATGVPVEPSERFDEEPTPRDVPRLAQGSGNERPVTGRVPKYEPGEIADREPNQRLAILETWRSHEIDPWRRRLTGDDERNGRVGRMDRRIEDNHTEVTAAIEALRADVGPSDERKAEREQSKAIASFKRWSIAKLLGAIGAIAVAAYGYLKVRDEARDAASAAKAAAAAAEARTETRLGHVEMTLGKVLDQLLNRSRTP